MQTARLALLLVVLGAGCKGEEPGAKLVDKAAFGVFFGGQIQDRSELALELDKSQQSIGIRVDFKGPLEREVKVDWELSKPARAKDKKGDAGLDRVVQFGQASARVGHSRLDVPLAFRSGDPLGSWHVRVKVEGQTVIDRDVVVRSRSELADAGE
jgi:hypothetical protein